MTDNEVMLYEALKALEAHYCALVESGDCGFWSLSDEQVVQSARIALSKMDGEIRHLGTP